MPAVYDQGELGSCTANGITALLQYRMLRQGLDAPMQSRLFIYYGERVIERTVNEDAGAQIRSGIKVVAKAGSCPESIWPYNVSKFAVRPPALAFVEAQKHQALKYARVTSTLDALRSALALDALPIVFGFSVYESFESEQTAITGQMLVPSRDEAVLGGHCVAIVGYDDKHNNGTGVPAGAFLCRNSWSASWGISDPSHPEFAGHFWFPYTLITSRGMASDFWVISNVEGEQAVKA